MGADVEHQYQDVILMLFKNDAEIAGDPKSAFAGELAVQRMVVKERMERVLFGI